MPFDPSTATLLEEPARQQASNNSGFDPSTARVFDPSSARLAEEPAPSVEQPGWFGTAAAGAMSGLRGGAQTYRALTGEMSGAGAEPTIEAAKPIEFSDVANPGLLGRKFVYGLASSAPEIVGFGAGAALAGGPETPVGLLAGAAGATLANAAKSFGPQFGAELKATPEDPDAAFNRALVSTGIGATFTGGSFAAFGAAPFESTLKNLMFQAFGVQPGLTVAQKGVENVSTGRPVGDNLTEGVPGAVLMTAAPAVAHAIAAPFRSRTGTTAPAPGTPEAIKADIDQAKQTAQAVRQARTFEQSVREEEGITQPEPTQPVPPQPTVQPPPATPPATPPGQPFTEAWLRPGDVKVDPERFQFKESGEKGVTGLLRGFTQWDPRQANPVTVWQAKDGSMWIADGHQRHDLATRAEAAGQENVYMPARIYREEDGNTVPYMKILAAYKNIGEGSGTTLDAAKVLRGKDAIPPDKTLPELPPKSQLVQGASALTKLSPNAWSMVENGLVDPVFAAHVGELIQDPKQQEAALSMLIRADPANSRQARMIVEDVRNSGFLEGAQQGLFGEEAFAQSLVPERARVLDGSLQTLRRTKGIYRAAVEGEQELTAAGNQLNTEANAAARTANERLVDTLQRNATTKGPISDALTSAARDLAGGQPRPRVQASFLSAVRRLVAKGEVEGLEYGDVSDRERPESETGPIEAEGQTGLLDSTDDFDAPNLQAPRKPPLPPATGPDLFGAQRAEPARRAPEPTIKGDQRQAVMPGMEPSARQAQASRDAAGPRGNQQPANEGLFARPETPQPELPTAPTRPVSRFPEAMGDNGVDLLHTVPNRMGGHDAARAWVVSQGQKTGHEHMAIVDNATGEIVHAHTNGYSHEVSIDIRQMPDDPGAYTVHHNHPSNQSLSPADQGVLVTRAISHVVAHGSGGDTYHASLSPSLGTVNHYDPTTVFQRYRRIRDLGESLQVMAKRIIEDAVLNGAITQPESIGVRAEVANRLMAAFGAIKYTSTKELPPALQQRLSKFIDRSVTFGRGSPDRFARSVRAEDRHSGLPGSDGGASRPTGRADQGRDQIRQGNAGRTRPADGEIPGDEGAQGRLLDEETARLEAPRQTGLGLVPARNFDVLKDKKGIDAFVSEIKSWFAPASMKGAETMRAQATKHGATLAQAFGQTVNAIQGVRDAVDRLDKNDQIDFMHRMETGQKQATPELQKIADVLRALTDGWTRKVQSLGRGYLANAIQNYMGHVWGNHAEWSRNLPPPTEAEMAERAQAAALGKNPLLGSKAFLKQRTFPTQLDGINAGLVPVTYNPVDLQLLKLREVQKFYFGTKLADEMKRTKIARWIPAGMERAASAEGLDKLDDSVFQPRLTGAANPAGFGRLEPGNWYAPEPAARLFNNYMSRGLAGQSVVYDTLRTAGNALNMAQLGLSGFHATFVTMDTMKSQVALGIQQIVRGDFLKGAVTSATGIAPFSPNELVRGARQIGQGQVGAGLASMGKSVLPYALTSAIREGNRLRSAWLDPANATPAERALADRMNEGGGRASMDQFYRSTASGPFFHSLGDLRNPLSPFYQAAQMFRDEPSYIRKAAIVPLRIAGRVMDTIAQPLMGYMVPRAKMGVFSKMAQDWMEAHPNATPEERSAAMIKAWDSVDNRLGQLVYDNLFWKKTGKDLAMLTTRSLGWNIGTIRELGGGLVDTAKIPVDLARGLPPQFTARMAYTIAMPLVTALYGSILNYLATGNSPQSTMDMFFPQTGTKTPQGEPERRNIPGYEKDVIEYSKAPLQTLLNKTNPLLETGVELYQNKDYYGGIIHHPDQPAIPSYADYLMRQAIPFSWRGWKRLEATHASGLDQALAFWGFQPAPASITQPEIGENFQKRADKQGLRKREHEPGMTHFFLPNLADQTTSPTQ